MKKQLLIATICVAGLVSCDLDQVPENQVTYNNAFKSENELNATTSSILYFENIYIGKNDPFIAARAKLTISVGTTTYVSGTHVMSKNKTDNGVAYTILYMKPTYS